MNRRNFVKDGCQLCLLGTAALALNGLTACSPVMGKAVKADIVNNKLEIPLALFEQKSTRIISPRKYAYDIAAHKNPDNSFTTLLLRCTHMDNQLTPSNNGFYCSLHGSNFDKEGNVVKGPAERKLRQLKTEIIQNNLIIYL